jgi:hypothetical protein
LGLKNNAATTSRAGSLSNRANSFLVSRRVVRVVIEQGITTLNWILVLDRRLSIRRCHRVTGYIDFSRAALGDTTKYAAFHMYIGFVLVGSVVVLTVWRWLVYFRRGLSPGASYLVAACLVVGVTLFQGWYGGEMVYSQGAGVAAAGRGTEPSDSGKQRLERVTR